MEHVLPTSPTLYLCIPGGLKPFKNKLPFLTGVIALMTSSLPPLFPPQIVSVDKGLERCAKMLKMLDEGAIEGGKLGV